MSEHYDDETLFKVYEGLAAAGVVNQQAVEAVNQMQNAGILFRERGPDREPEEKVDENPGWPDQVLVGYLENWPTCGGYPPLPPHEGYPLSRAAYERWVYVQRQRKRAADNSLAGLRAEFPMWEQPEQHEHESWLEARTLSGRLVEVCSCGVMLR